MQLLRYLLGLVTLAAGILGGTYLWSLLEGRRVEGEFPVTLLFESAEGLHAGAAIKYRGVRVGEVRSVGLGSAGEFSEVSCALFPEARGSVRASTQFWIVRPIFEGIAGGATGLDTLIKDSYISYFTSPRDASPLSEGARIPGLSAPPGTTGSRAEMQGDPGDLPLTVVFAESSGLKPGSEVRYRGMDVGVVTSVEMAADGVGIIVQARIGRAYRGTISDKTVFWVARPGVDAGLFSGFEVRDLDALITGTHLSYYTPRQSDPSPVKDRARFAGSASRPDFRWPPIRLEDVSLPESGPEGQDPLTRSLVTVHYSCRERDWLSPNDSFSFESPGLLYATEDGVPAVLVARSGVDGAWTVKDSGKPEIYGEVFRVTLPDGSVVSGGRVWVDPDGADLALLRVVGSRPLPSGAPICFDPPAAAGESVLEVIAIDGRGQRQRYAATLREDGTIAGIDRNAARGLVLREGAVIGVVGVKEGDTAPPRLVRVSILPASLRSATP